MGFHDRSNNYSLFVNRVFGEGALSIALSNKQGGQTNPFWPYTCLPVWLRYAVLGSKDSSNLAVAWGVLPPGSGFTRKRRKTKKHG